MNVDTEEDMARLRAHIETLADETRLSPEPRLAEELGVSRGRLRTLLKRLESEGAIWRHVGKGTFVGRPMLAGPRVELAGGASLNEIMDARLLFEPLLAARAAIMARPADIAALESCMAEMRAARQLSQWKRLDERLHHLIAEATHNSLLVLQYETLRTHGRTGLDGRLQDVFGGQLPPADTTTQHADIVRAIDRHDPALAEGLMRAHLASVRDRLFGLA
ncbi:FadR/GntR family transcriptional regulator [Paracoccus yeei]|uniref:FadR/GntR family transcriptional regulator n=1 Tax=Paracoccus yeei TaxID=147645 RepID=UPI00242FCD62|nr:FCD domain-containing protein [Paracoccus yeei]